MNFKIARIVFFSFFANKMHSQATENVKTKGKWFFGAEVGLNAITSVHKSRMTAFQGGLL